VTPEEQARASSGAPAVSAEPPQFGIEEPLRRTATWLFSADANLLAMLADGTSLVVRIGHTTFDNLIRAMQSLCENNVLGIVANGARASDLYSKYTYYYSRPE